MRSPTVLVLLVAVLVVSLAFAQSTGPTPILPGTVHWVASPIAPGLEGAWFVGAENRPGVYVFRVKIPAGAVIPPHTHPDERNSTVLSGTIYVGFGETFDKSKAVAIPAGGMYVAPANVPHFVWAKDGDAVYQESGIGPTATNVIRR